MAILGYFVFAVCDGQCLGSKSKSEVVFNTYKILHLFDT